MKLALFCNFINNSRFLKVKEFPCIFKALQSGVMVAKDIFHFTTMTQGCKEKYFSDFSNEFNRIYRNFKEFLSKRPYSWENSKKFTSLQPSVTVAKAKISFFTIFLLLLSFGHFCIHFYNFVGGYVSFPLSCVLALAVGSQ